MHFYSVIWQRGPSSLYRVFVWCMQDMIERESTTHSVTNRTCNAGRVGGSEFSMQCDQTDYRRLFQWVSIGTAARGNEPKSNELNETQWNGTARTKRSRTNERTTNCGGIYVLRLFYRVFVSVHANLAWSKLAGEQNSINFDLFYIYRKYIYVYNIIFLYIL